MNQLAIYKCGGRFELGTGTKNKSSGFKHLDELTMRVSCEMGQNNGDFMNFINCNYVVKK